MTAPAPAPVSAIIAVKNGERHLAEAIDSVLSQSPPPTELLVVDGASTDRSAEIARGYDGVQLIPQEGDGLAGAWNQAIEAAEQELIAFLDSDDIWLPGKLKAQLDLLARQEHLAGVYGLARFVIAPGAEAPPGFRMHLLEGEHPARMPGTLLVRREAFDEIGVFDPAYIVALDVDWFFRLQDAGLLLEMIPELMIEKRFHADNLSHSQPERYQREVTMAARESVARRRGAA